MSSGSKDARAALTGLLDLLEERADDGLARVTYSGIAVSRSKDHLHLAVPSGVLAIPLDEIEDVAPIHEVRPQNVFVAVRNANAIRHLIRVDQLGGIPLPDPEGPPDGGWHGPWPPGPKHFQIGMSGSATESYTRSGNPPQDDACDDSRNDDVS
jgi:hypothetical protein